MSPERRREVSSMGGKAAHRLKRAHEWTREEAVIQGRKGGRPKGWRKKKNVLAEIPDENTTITDE